MSYDALLACVCGLVEPGEDDAEHLHQSQAQKNQFAKYSIQIRLFFLVLN